ncbi:MAG: 30S ribosomal protein S6 [Caldilineales bacterium]|nr:30S ribosomal protein S6 [Caldilineales bacterium]
MSDYEMVTLLHPRLDDEGVQKVSQWVQERISSLGGEVVAQTPWGRRTLAFPIAKQTEATYIQVDFRLDGNKIEELNRAMRFNEDILRQLAVRKHS